MVVNKNISTLVIGGCRSGKSDFALKLAESEQNMNKIFIATLQALDDEMNLRIQKHQSQRDDKWKTIEEPLNIAHIIKNVTSESTLILVDCITLWISNILLAPNYNYSIEKSIDDLLKSIEKVNGKIIIVSNEVGAGIVPDNKLSRQFRDYAGFANQKIASIVNNVFFTVAGIPIHIKKSS